MISVNEEQKVAASSETNLYEKEEKLIASADFILHEQELNFIKKFQPPSREEIVKHQIFMGKKTKKFTLLLDLDETLVSARCFIGKRQALHGKKMDILVRPYCDELLETLSELYEIVIFTASEEDYALKVVKILDPEGKHISKVLSRENCILREGLYVKDLRVIADRSVDEMLIVDNSVISFAFQLQNGIPIASYFGEDGDEELGYLGTYLQNLYNEEKIVETNKKNFGLIS